MGNNIKNYGYKIFDIHKSGRLQFLFHGHDGTRFVPTNVWLKANRKLRTNGTRSIPYYTGFHYFKTADDALGWKGSFKNRIILKIMVKKTKRKENTNIGAYIADEIYVPTYNK